jgi:hypothetical protein
VRRASWARICKKSHISLDRSRNPIASESLIARLRATAGVTIAWHRLASATIIAATIRAPIVDDAPLCGLEKRRDIRDK